jgi:hypothetical protein
MVAPIFETALEEMLALGHNINPDYWTQGERGFSNLCVNCGRVIGLAGRVRTRGGNIEGLST